MLNHRRATKECSIASIIIWLKTRHAVCRIMSKVCIPCSLETVYNTFEKIEDMAKTAPYLLGNFRKFILNIVSELRSKYLQKIFYLS